MKKLKQNKIITAVLEGENGFTRTMKINSRNLPREIKIPFLYRLRISSPVVGDYMDLELSPVGKFVLRKLTKAKAFYRLDNMYQVKVVEK